jgi:hypothetical protein
MVSTTTPTRLDGLARIRRERLRVLWTAAARQRLADDVDPTEAVELAARLHADEPLDEDALRLHVHWLSRAGQLASARRVYQAFTARLRRNSGRCGLAAGSNRSREAMLLRAVMEPARRRLRRFRRPRRRLMPRGLLGEDCRLLSTGPGGWARHVWPRAPPKSFAAVMTAHLRAARRPVSWTKSVSARYVLGILTGVWRRRWSK